MSLETRIAECDLIDRIRQLSSPMTPRPSGVLEHLRKLDDIRAVVFDVYGTLFISGTGDISIAREMSNEQALTEALQFAGFSGNLEEAGSYMLGSTTEITYFCSSESSPSQNRVMWSAPREI